MCFELSSNITYVPCILQPYLFFLVYDHFCIIPCLPGIHSYIMSPSACLCIHIWHTSLDKYGWHIANMTHTAIMRNEDSDLTFLSIPTKIQPTATPISHTIAKYVPETNMPFKCHMYVTYTSIYASYKLTAINNVTRTTGEHTFHIYIPLH